MTREVSDVSDFLQKQLYTPSFAAFAHYADLLDLLFKVIRVTQGRTGDTRLEDVHQLATKLQFHALTLFRLCCEPGNLVLHPLKPHIHDFALIDSGSVQVLFRAALETYLTMYEVFFELSTKTDEFEYRHALWQLEGMVTWEKFARYGMASAPAELVSALEAKVSNVDATISQLEQRIKNTLFFSKLCPEQQKKLLPSKPYKRREFPQNRRSRADIAKAAGLGTGYIDVLYSLQSGYAHSDGLASSQIEDLTKTTIDIQLDTSMRLVMWLIAKTILEYARHYESARIICVQTPVLFEFVQRLADEAAQTQI